MKRVLTVAVVIFACVIPIWRVGTAHAMWAHMHYWSANGTTADSFGGPSGSLMNGATYGPGVHGQAFLFPGSGSSVNFSSSLGSFGTGDFSIGFEAKTTETGTFDLVNKRSICNFSNFWDIRVVNGLFVGEIDEASNGPDYALIHGTTPINDGQWHRISFARSGYTVYFEVDGKIDSQITTRYISNVSNAADVRAGADVCDGLDGTVSFNGEIDDLFIGSSN